MNLLYSNYLRGSYVAYDGGVLAYYSTINDNSVASYFADLQPNTTYTLTRITSTSRFRVATFYTDVKNSTGQIYSIAQRWYADSYNTITFTTGSADTHLVVYYTNSSQYDAQIMLNEGSEAEPYEAPTQSFTYAPWTGVEGEYPSNGVEPAPPFSHPYPAAMWRIDGAHNNGYPWHELLRNIPYDPPPPPEPEAEEPIIVQYDIYCDDKLMHSSIVGEEAYKVIEPVLDLQDSAAGSLEFSLPPFNVMYGNMLMMKSTLKVYKNGEEIFECRPVSYKEDMWLNHNVTCEGELAYLNDIFQVQAKYENVTLEQFLYAIIGVNNGNIDITKGYNQRASENRRFNVGIVPTPDVPEAADLLTIVVPFESTLSTINSVCSKYKLHVAVNKRLNENSGNIERYLDFYSENGGLGENSTQSIIFGENLVDYAKSYNFAATVTTVLPLGAKSNSAGKVVADETAALTPVSTQSNRVIWPSNSKDSSGTMHYAGDIVDISNITNYQDADKTKYKVYSYSITEENDTVFISAQQKMGAGMVVVYNGQNKYYLKNSKKSDTLTVWTESKNSTWYTSYDTSVPTTLCVGTYDAPPVVYKSKTVDSGLEDYVTVEAVNNGELWVTNETTMGIYGRIEKKIEFSSDKDAWTLYNDAVKYLASDQFDGLQIDITAVDMAVLGVKNVRRLRVGEMVRCIAECYGLDSMMPITGMKIPLDKPEDTKYTVGYKLKQNLTSVNNSTNSELLAMIAEKPTTSAVLSAAKTEAAQFLNDTKNGYVSYRYSENGETEAIIVSETKDYKTSPSGYWIFGKNGIGHVTSYAQEESQYTTANVAMTKDGKIVADYITAGTMLADRIHGGTLTLGYWIQPSGDPLSGKILMVDQYNNPMLRIARPPDGDGVEIFPGSDANGDAIGPWMCIKDGTTYFGHAENGVVTDGMSWSQRPQVFGGSTLSGDGGYFRSLSLYTPGHLVLQLGKGLAWYDGSAYHDYSYGLAQPQVGNKRLNFYNGILVSVDDMGGGNTYSGTFTVDGKDIEVSGGLIMSVTQHQEQNNNE